ncbi:MAG TPA: 3-hydroxybutyryl-CoA dehydrogenase [Candidatus Polarisedimenticolia bacterium]|nr:3-hydroxybutyryl-CoA dehydrogenase [Candidatus Polarisedimenticolia bacterium]
MPIKKVGVLGCGLMGSGIAQVAAQSGFPTAILEATPALVQAGMQRITKFLDGGVAKGKVTPADRDATLGRLKAGTEPAGLADCDLVIEAITENLGAKREIFGRLEPHLKADAILASNTSSLSITEMAAATGRPTRFVGLHFFNPVPLMKLVEVVRTVQTAPGVEESVSEFARALGKTAIRTTDRTGFIVNRLLVPYLLDAIRAVEEGVGSIADIDAGMKLGCGHPMGPLTLNDLVGIDTTYSISRIMFDEFKEKRFAAPPLMKRMVMAGFLGRKSGRGFYDYSVEPAKPNDFLTGWNEVGR